MYMYMYNRLVHFYHVIHYPHAFVKAISIGQSMGLMHFTKKHVIQ